MNKKILIFGIMLIMVAGCSNKKNKNIEPEPVTTVPTTTATQIVNTNMNVVKNQKVDGIDISDTSVITNNGITQIITTVTNNTENDYTLKQYIIIAKDVKGNVIARIPSYVGNTIKVGETKILNSSIDISLEDAYSFEYEVIK